MLNKQSEFNVATTAFLTNFWKDQARQKNNWSKLAINQGSREKDLFKDDLLHLFYDESIAKEATERLDHRMWLPLATRTRYFRKTISEAIKTYQITQIIILGCGFDTLAVRKHRYPVQFFEIDQTKIMDCKKAIYAEHDIDPNAIYIGLDYTKQDLMAALKATKLDINKVTLILWEGNTFYLEKDMVMAIIELLSKNFPKFILSFDFMHEKIQDEKTTLDSFEKRQSPFKGFFNIAEIMKITQSLNLNCKSHFTAAELAKQYQVDDTPYHTAEPYSVATFVSESLSTEQKSSPRK